MKSSYSLIKLAQKALAESIDFKSMIQLAREVIPNYDINIQSGLPENLSAGSRIEAARQIIEDMDEHNFLIQFINSLLGTQFQGYNGKVYKISGLNELLKELYFIGFIYDEETNTLLENRNIRKSRNWGVLMDGRQYSFSFLWIDIAGYSKLVKRFPIDILQSTHEDYISIVSSIIEKRNGRIWSVDGDGLLCAYHFSNKTLSCVLSAIEIVHELFAYNRLYNRLGEPINVRLAVHNDMCEYYNDDRIKRGGFIENLKDLGQKSTRMNSLIITGNVKSMLEPVLSDLFIPLSNDNISDCYYYELKWGK